MRVDSPIKTSSLFFVVVVVVLIVSLRCLSSLAAPHGEIPNFEVFIVRT